MRRRNWRTRFILTATLPALLLMGVGCGSKEVTPDEQVPSEFAGAPEWVLQGCGAYWGDDGGARLCGVGEARLGSSMSIARTKATSRARAEISRTLETKVKNMIKDFQEEVTDGESEMTAEQFSSTTVALSKATLNGTQVQQTWVSPSDRLYILVALDVEAFDASVREMDEMSDRLRTFIESRSRKSFEELEEQMEEY